MGLPFLSSKARKIDQILAIDLGAHSTKAVHLQRKGEQVALMGYAIENVVSRDGGLSPEALTPRLSQIAQAVGGRCRQVVLALGAGDSLLRLADMPMVGVADMRTMLKFNAKNYLQQDLNDYAFDCYILPPRPGVKAEAPKPGQKIRVLVGGAKDKLVNETAAAVKAAGLVAEALVPGLIGPVNAFELAQPEVFRKEAVALVDLGFRHSTVSLLLEGEPILTRVVAIGGDHVTSAIAETLGIGYEEAENIKMGLAHEVQSAVETVLSPLGRELRASIDYFEHQQDKTVTQIHVSGAPSASEYMLEILKTELMVPCVPWNPVAPLALSLPPQQMGEVEPVAPRLAVAIGAGLAVM
jgi:type IV pilus assembly protein PilM